MDDGRFPQNQGEDDVNQQTDQDAQKNRRVMPVQVSLQTPLRRSIAFDAALRQFDVLVHHQRVSFAPKTTALDDRGVDDRVGDLWRLVRVVIERHAVPFELEAKGIHTFNEVLIVCLAVSTDNPEGT